MKISVPFIPAAVLMLAACGAAFSQNAAESPQRLKFEVADVHVSPNAAPGTFGGNFMRMSPLRNGNVEIHNGSLVDLIRLALGFDADKIIGGPSWLEMTRFDITAKAPAETTQDDEKLMLQSLLEDRLGLKTHKDTKALPTWVLTAGKNPKLKAADGSGDTGCRPQSIPNVPAGGIRIGLNGSPLTLGPGGQLLYSCHNMTMAAFAAGLRNMLGASVGPNAVQDGTGLKGAWNFDVRWSVRIGGPLTDSGDFISVFDAVDKQLGLKLEQRQMDTPVLIVDAANETPTPNPPGTTEALPAPAAIPTEFEVADIKPSDPAQTGGRMSMQPGGRLSAQGMPIQFFLSRAFDVPINQIVGLPNAAGSSRFDINAKAPAGAADVNFQTMGPMLRKLLEDRFKLKFHTEQRPQSAYILVAGKPKMKKADPASRTHCVNGDAPSGSPSGTVILVCQNITMAQFAAQLRGRGQGLDWPVEDSTGIGGSWDFTLTYNARAGLNLGGGGRGGAGEPVPASQTGTASDPEGGLSIFEAVEKQLGLKLEMQKRPEPVIVIDHLEEKPTDN